jgi:RNA polymerase sigma-70 factor (ECF subfamily)
MKSSDSPVLGNEVAQYYQKVLKMALFYLKNEEEARDITQEIFYKISKKLHTFRGESKIYTWIFTLARNTILNYIRRCRIVRFFSLDDQYPRQEWATTQNPEKNLQADEQRQESLETLQKGIDDLSNREKTAFYLFYYEDVKQKEIARIMRTSLSAVESLIHKSRKKIRKRFDCRSS